MTAIVTTGDARFLPFPDDSIDLVVTSPPYFGLRKYAAGVDTDRAPIGEEPTARRFVESLLEVTAECARVLKPSGSLFVNLGDRYGPDKGLCLVPERYRIACTDELGLIARAVIVWAKPNGLPESVRDRVRRSHEDWVHLTKSPRYFQSVDEIREPHTMRPQRRGVTKVYGEGQNASRAGREVRDEVTTDGNPLGKLPGSVWSIATQPLRVPAELEVDHFAAFPMEWPRRLITGWCPRDVCSACGEGRRPVTGETTLGRNRGGSVDQTVRATEISGGTGRQTLGMERTVAITGYACACPDTSAPSTPGIVLDPFGGTGTTALVADVLGRVGISYDASTDYARIAQWRTTDEKQRARAARDIPRPEQQGPPALFAA